VFRELQHTNNTELSATGIGRELFTTYRRQLLALAGLTIAVNVANYTLLAYLPTYLQMSIGRTSGQTDSLIIIGQAVMIFFLPLAGLLSDRIGRKPVWWISLTGLFVLVTPAYMLMTVGFGWAVLAFAVLSLVYLLQMATVSSMFPAIFPAHVRYAGFAISYNVATALFGGTAPAVNDWLIDYTQNALTPAYYMMGAFVVGMIALRFIPETRGCSLRGRGVPGLQTSPEVSAVTPRD
jgi:MHS family proline/betaine transporter-like MFS transporter